MSGFDEDTLRDFVRRGMAMQEAVDAILSPQRQAAERERDGSYRVKCSNCGKSVSSPLPIAVIVRAFVECPECIGRRIATEGG